MEKAWAADMMDTIFPAGADPAIADGARDLDMDQHFDDLIDAFPLMSAVALRGSVWVMAFAPLFVIGRPKTFSGLAPEERLAVLDRMGSADAFMWRSFPTLLKTVGALAFASSTRLRPHGTARVHPATA